MNIKKSMLIASMALILGSACADTKTKDVKVDAETVEKAKAEMKKEVLEREAEVKAAKKRIADSLKTVDSLEQVKTHGHAH